MSLRSAECALCANLQSARSFPSLHVTFAHRSCIVYSHHVTEKYCSLHVLLSSHIVNSIILM